MEFLDIERLNGIDARVFQTQEPYPWLNPEGLLTADGYRKLLATLPPPARFDPRFGRRRAHGQASHDRLALEYDDRLDVSEAWHAFVAELRGSEYADFLHRLFGRRRLALNFHWHYTPRGCSVSPHCDARHKLGSHIFSCNTADDWHPAWGGQTLILDAGGRFNRRSAPRFEDFARVISTETIGNRSVLFQRRGDSWHGVRELACPDGAFRKVFIVVIDDRFLALKHRLLKRLRGRPVGDAY
jgi:ribosomal protein L31